MGEVIFASLDLSQVSYPLCTKKHANSRVLTNPEMT